MAIQCFFSQPAYHIENFQFCRALWQIIKFDFDPKRCKKFFLADFQVWIWSVILILKSVTNAPASPLPKVDFFFLKICLKSRTFRPIFLPIINCDFDPKGAIYDRAFIRFLWLIIKCDFNPKNPPKLEFFSKLAYKIEHYPYFFGR